MLKREPAIQFIRWTIFMVMMGAAAPGVQASDTRIVFSSPTDHFHQLMILDVPNGAIRHIMTSPGDKRNPAGCRRLPHCVECAGKILILTLDDHLETFQGNRCHADSCTWLAIPGGFRIMNCLSRSIQRFAMINIHLDDHTATGKTKQDHR